MDESSFGALSSKLDLPLSLGLSLTAQGNLLRKSLSFQHDPKSSVKKLCKFHQTYLLAGSIFLHFYLLFI